MQISSAIEFYKGITDIPLVLVAGFFAIFLKKFDDKKNWSSFFMTLAGVAFIGAVVHIFTMDDLYHKIIWAVLYILLYEVIRNLVVVIGEYITGQAWRYPKLMWIAEAVFVFFSLGFLFTNSKYDIYVFVAFCVINLAWVIYFVGKNKLTTKFILFIAACIVSVALQLLKEIVPYAVAIEHITMLVATCVLFSMALDD